MTEPVKILYAEDEFGLGKIVKESLELLGYEVVWETDGQAALARFREVKPHICLFDVMMPKMDGFELGKAVQAASPNTPIIYLTARDQTEDVLEGFQSGGNDYMRKPFSMKELEVRIQNILSLKENGRAENVVPETLTLGKFTFNTATQELSIGANSDKLTHKEAALLTKLGSSINQVVERKAILIDIWEDDSFFHSRSLDVYIKKLRNYLKPDPELEIVTLKGVGYRLVFDGK